MARRKTPEELLKQAQQVLGQVDLFNAKKPHATWSQIEDAVDDALSGLRRDLIAQSVQGHALADFRRAAERPSCPRCGAPLHAIGQDTRRVTTRGDAVIEVERTRGRCSGCGAELFPPG